MADVFVSYASADREKAQAIGQLLASRGYSVWWDRTIPAGEIFDEVIQRSLDAAKCVVVLWSEASVVSNWVKTEAAEAAGRNILVPVLIANVRLPMEFKRIQSANLAKWDLDPGNPELQNLLAAVAREVASPSPKTATPSSVKAGGTDEALTNRSRRPPYLGYALAVGVVVVAAGTIAYWQYPKGDPPTSDKKAVRTDTQIAAKRTDDSPSAGSRSAGAPQAADHTTKTALPALPPSDKTTKTALPAPQASASDAKTALPSTVRVNLLATENGGQLIAAPDTVWMRSIKDYDDLQAWAGNGEGVFAFKDQRPATFDTFAVLIPRINAANLNEFELLTSNESPTGRFESIGRFATQNLRLMTSPYQEFKFPPVKAKYLKVKLLTDHQGRKGSAALHKFQLMGTLD